MAQTEIQVLDKTFISALSAAEIDAAVDKVAQQLTRDYADKNPIFLMILNGSFMFASDLLKRATFPAEMASIKLSHRMKECLLRGKYARSLDLQKILRIET